MRSVGDRAERNLRYERERDDWGYYHILAVTCLGFFLRSVAKNISVNCLALFSRFNCLRSQSGLVLAGHGSVNLSFDNCANAAAVRQRVVAAGPEEENRQEWESHAKKATEIAGKEREREKFGEREEKDSGTDIESVCVCERERQWHRYRECMCM